ELTELIHRQKPDALTFTTPSRIRQYLEYDRFAEELSTFSYIAVGGEILPQDVVSKILDNADTDIFNIYGPTETTVTCNSINITSPDNITVGKALHNYVTDVRDIDGKLLPDGIIGELYIGGVGVSRGYHNLDDKTEEVFVTINDIPYYKSGDYAIELPNGEIDVKGRIDNQIKLRGLRIEIGEIEANIAKFPHIRQNVVVIKEINNNEHLCAYFTADEEIDTDDLKEYLTQYLTRYMVPTVFMQIDEMPMTPNGKTDINQLPEPKLKLEYVAPENELEQLICAVFSSTLGIETVGAEDNFFEIGGTSLVASKIILELLKRDYTVKYDDVFSNQTPRQLARFLSGEHEVRDGDYDIADDYDYSQINNLLSENTLENFYNGEKQEIGNLLLTGVTGYLGIHVLYDYIKNEKGTVYCMLRKGGFDSCKDRLADLFDYYFDGELTDLIGSRIILSEGDITELDDFKKLENYPIDTLINCAAIVKHYTADDYIFKVNVDGVINGIKYAQANDVRYVQISTTSVLSYPVDMESARDVQLDERTLYYRQDLSNKYVNSKFLAERMLLEAAVDGLDVKIIRVGNLMGRYRDGLFQKNYDTNAFLANIKSIKNIQAISTSMYGEAEEMSPIDCTAKAIIALSKTPQKCRVFNCQNNNDLLNSDIINVLNSFGYGILEVDDDEFMRICRENMDENIQGLITSDMSIADEGADEEDDYEYDLKTDQTVEILESLGFEWVKPDTDYLTRVIGYLNDLGFFN
ncbi:SDR family oxidoreductase, partial [Methanobrevibacter sp. UBA212]|uniref:SDR family oxidoreductase n=1 Tax=Methanobrevibacter sp. UBA212 TaxID=1915476 RepID=UPI0025EDE14F